MISKISLALCILLSIAVAYLFFTRTKPMVTSSGEEIQIAPALQTEGGPKPVVLAYINADTLDKKYKFIIDKTEQFKKSYDSASEVVQRELMQRQAEAQKWEKYLQGPNVTDAERMQAQQDIMRMEQEMAAIEKKEQDRIAKKEMDIQTELRAKVSKFLETYSKQRGIDYVVNHQSEFQVLLYGNNAYDITNEVIAGLNAEYEAEQTKK